MAATMILAHPRSRSHLLGTFFLNYINEPFTPGFIRHTPFFEPNKHLLKEGEGASFDSPFAKNYLQWLRETMDKVDNFTFKAHWCDIKQWDEARDLIKYWMEKPGAEFVTCERENKCASVMSLLVAELRGFVSYDMRKTARRELHREEVAQAFIKVVPDWYEGLSHYQAKYDVTCDFTYERMLVDLQAFTRMEPEAFAEALKNNRFQDQQTDLRITEFVLNPMQVYAWINQMKKDYDANGTIPG